VGDRWELDACPAYTGLGKLDAGYWMLAPLCGGWIPDVKLILDNWIPDSGSN